MSLDPYISNYIYQNREISLQGIGNIKLQEPPPDAEYLQKQRILPVNGLEFEYNPHAVTSPEFIKFYSEKRGKIQSLAENDVEAFLSISTQFLNIGNPVEIKGLGVITKQRDGSLIMSPGYYIGPLVEANPPRRIKERLSEQPYETTEKRGHRERTLNRNPERSFPILPVLIGILALAVTAYGLYYFLFADSSKAAANSPSSADTLVTSNIPVGADTAIKATTVVDSATTAQNLPLLDSTNLISWKAIFREEPSKILALKAMKKYSSIKTPIKMETSDSVNYRFFVEFQATTSDTTFKKDSIRKFFMRPIKLERSL